MAEYKLSDLERGELIENNRKAIRSFWRERYNRDRLITTCANLDEYIACKGNKYKPESLLPSYYWDGFSWRVEIHWGDW